MHRHDLESFLYLLFWIVCRFDAGTEIENPPFSKWEHATLEWLYFIKCHFFDYVPPAVTGSYGGSGEVVVRIWGMFREGFHVCVDAQVKKLEGSYDGAMLNGWVTGTAFIEELKNVVAD